MQSALREMQELQTGDERQLMAAVEKYLRRKARVEHPKGRSDHKRWYPAEDERCECCDTIRLPSCAYPWSLMLHCRTVPHIARLMDVSEDLLRDAIRADTKQKKVCSAAKLIFGEAV